MLKLKNILAAALVAIALAGGITFGVRDAFADTQAEQFDQFYEGYSGNLDHFTFSAVCDECWDDGWDAYDGQTGIGSSIGVDGNFNWKANASSILTYDPALVRQGSTLDTMTTTLGIPGSVTVNYHLYGHQGLHQRADADSPWNPTDLSFGVDAWLTSTVSCPLPLQPGEYVCQKEEHFGLGSVWTPFAYAELTLKITTTITMDQTGVVGIRVATVDAGQPIADAPVSYIGPGPGLFIDPLFISCTQPEGEMLTYSLEDMHLTATNIEVGHAIGLTVTVKDPLLTEEWGKVNFFNVNLFGSPEFGTVNVTTPDVSFALGEIAPDVTPPTIEDLGFFVGLEGSPIQFHADAYDNCGPPTLVWNFSDGGVAYGPDPEHVFADDGVYTGMLTATDVLGLTTTTTFSVTVVNQKPIANAGPDALEAWGVQVPFNGQAVDPGSADQGTLSYEWDFGDNSPKGHAEDVTHAYTTPGTYIATLKVCDKETSCDTDTREVVIRKRTTSASYLGSQTWTYDTETMLSASLVDEFGQPVNGRAIGFSIDGTWVAGANTNSMGIADRSYQVVQMAGNHNVFATFGGDSLYEGDSSFASSIVVVKQTVLTYTGPLTGAPNKVVSFSAALKDAQGKPLAGRTVTFQLGTQSVSATTDANGFAIATLKLTQKQGSYSLITSWTPAGQDAVKYAAAGDLDAFKISAK